MTRLHRFWRRVSDGMELNQLWQQFRADTRTSYRLYSHEIDATRTPGVGKGKHFLHVANQFFWAIMEKLTPARRVLLLLALVMVVMPGGEATWRSGDGSSHISIDTRFWGSLLLLVLLLLEVTDRVVMKLGEPFERIIKVKGSEYQIKCKK